MLLRQIRDSLAGRPAPPRA